MDLKPLPKSWEMLHSMGIFRTSSLGDSVSSDRTVRRRWVEDSGYTEVCNKAGSLKVKSFCELKPDTSRNLALFYIWGNARVWAHWNHALHMHLGYLGPVTCLFQAHCRELATAWWLLDRKCSSWLPKGLKFTFGEPKSLITVTSWLLIGQEILHFSGFW